MKDESGKMSKENILRIGIGTIGMLGIFSQMEGFSQPQGWSHDNYEYRYTTLRRTGTTSSYDNYSTVTHRDHYDHLSYH